MLTLATVLFFSLQAYAQTETPDATAKKLSSTIAKPGTLSDKDLESLQTEYTDEKTGQKIVFTASFGATKPKSAFDAKKIEKSGKIPIRITCSLSEIKQVNGKNLSKLLSGTARIYILDSDDKVVLTQSASLDKMCPS